MGITPALLLVSAIATAACQSSQATAQSSTEPVVTVVDVPTVTATAGTIEAALEISGTLAPRARVPVKPRLPGALERVLVDIGDAVSEGQTIATIDRREIDAQADAAVAAVSVAKAALETSEATLANAIMEHERYLVGQDPTDIELHWQAMFRWPRWRGRVSSGRTEGGPRSAWPTTTRWIPSSTMPSRRWTAMD